MQNNWNRELKRKVRYLFTVGVTSMTLMACGDTTSSNQTVTETPYITEDTLISTEPSITPTASIQMVTHIPEDIITSSPHVSNHDVKVNESTEPQVTEEIEAYDLVRDSEEIIAKFQLIATGEMVVICTYKETEEYLVVRIGTDSQINFEYPINLEDSWKQFQLHTYLRGGGPGNEGMDLRYLTFQDNNFLYTIYEEYYSEDDSTSIGLRKVNLETGDQQDLEGDYSSLEGSISSLEDNEKIQVVED